MRQLTAIVACLNFLITTILKNSFCLIIIFGGCEIGSACSAQCEDKVIEVSYNCGGGAPCIYEQTVCVPAENELSLPCTIYLSDENCHLAKTCQGEPDQKEPATLNKERQETRLNIRNIILSFKSEQIPEYYSDFQISYSRPNGINKSISTTVLRI